MATAVNEAPASLFLYWYNESHHAVIEGGKLELTIVFYLYPPD
jgi:hypothetical protein